MGETDRATAQEGRWILSTEHILKCWPEPYSMICVGRKRHEIRVNDRNFKEGDILRLREFVPPSPVYGGYYTGREVMVAVTYINYGPTWGIPGNVCVMSIQLMPGQGVPG